MLDDPIVDEIHAVRAQLLNQHGGDLSAYFAALLKMQLQHPDRYVSFVQPLPAATPNLLTNTRSELG